MDNFNITADAVCFSSAIGKYVNDQQPKLKSPSVDHYSDYVYRSPKVSFSEPKLKTK